MVPDRQRHKHNEGYSHSMESGTTRYGGSLFLIKGACQAQGWRRSFGMKLNVLPKRALKKRISELENPQV